MLQLRIMDECLESGGQINVIYADFEKAFDKVSHKSESCVIIRLITNQ